MNKILLAWLALFSLHTSVHAVLKPKYKRKIADLDFRFRPTSGRVRSKEDLARIIHANETESQEEGFLIASLSRNDDLVISTEGRNLYATWCKSFSVYK